MITQSEGDIIVRPMDVGRLALNIRETGQGPLVIFLHGITSNAAVFDPLMLAIRNRAHCVAVDQRGHGLSDKPASGYEAEDFAHDLLQLIKKLGDGPALVVGHSLGARNGLVAAVIEPQLISSVLAIDFTPYIESEVLDTLAARVNGGDRLFASLNEIVTYLHERYPLMPVDATRRRAASGYTPVDGGFRPLASPSAMAATAAGLRGDLIPATEMIRCPVLMVRGALSKLVSEKAFERTRKLRPDLDFLVVDGADHYVNEETPDVIIVKIHQFLDRMSEADFTFG